MGPSDTPPPTPGTPDATVPATRAGGRIVGFDLARALAILGMVIVNFKVVMNAEGTGPGWLQWATGLLDGRAAATFVVLAGIGASLMVARPLRHHDSAGIRATRLTLLRRGAFLFVIGLAFFPIWPADILHYYGLYLAAGALLLTTSDRTLWLAAGFAALVSFTFILGFDYFANWNLDDLSYEGFWTPAGFLRNLFFDGFHPVFPWVAFYFYGVWLGRRDLRSARVRNRLLVRAVAVAVAAEALATVIAGKVTEHSADVSDERWTDMFLAAPIPPLPLYLLAGGATATVVILACVAFGERFGDRRWLFPLVATGQLALTIYVAHVVVGMGTLEELGRLEDQTLPFAVWTALLFCVAAVVFAALWRRRFRRGPLEALMRRIAG